MLSIRKEENSAIQQRHWQEVHGRKERKAEKCIAVVCVCMFVHNKYILSRWSRKFKKLSLSSKALCSSLQNAATIYRIKIKAFGSEPHISHYFLTHYEEVKVHLYKQVFIPVYIIANSTLTIFIREEKIHLRSISDGKCGQMFCLNGIFLIPKVRYCIL